jgi:hypothetical protein
MADTTKTPSTPGTTPNQPGGMPPPAQQPPPATQPSPPPVPGGFGASSIAARRAAHTIPDGDYNATVTKVSSSMSAAGRSALVHFKLPDGRTVTVAFLVEPSSARPDLHNLADDGAEVLLDVVMAATGQDEWPSLPEALKALTGKTVGIHLKTERKKGQTNQRVTSAWPVA